eukprot:CAMPEP_0116553504 /NCGR_PEP_ID=MMETSP0397-20121206/7088_1 /TAXON_ID=216820 /ORGANISM="Cyclophora tenuis, Strain ECT3854" /LENGTH=190 /DNA_ID=CAMNT_0004078591 /DNA_START=60 /DNA_END=628 /DNA_ORIENTATION=-
MIKIVCSLLVLGSCCAATVAWTQFVPPSQYRCCRTRSASCVLGRGLRIEYPRGLARSIRPNHHHQHHHFGKIGLSAVLNDDIMVSGTPLVLLMAIVLGVLAQGFINQMMEGDQGLGAFLRDGSGYNRSGFVETQSSSSDPSPNDPLPWLKLPDLDFVEVAGSNSKQKLELEGLRREMQTELELGNMERAT